DPGIREWREELRKKHAIGTFGRDPTSVPLGPAVSCWLQESVTPAAKRPAVVPPFDFASYLESKRRDFVGRGWLFDEIEAGRSTRQERALLIVGDPGIGKPTILAELIHRDPERVLAFHCCRADSPATLQPDLAVRQLAAQLTGRL